jgi:hypothetical protein
VVRASVPPWIALLETVGKNRSTEKATCVVVVTRPYAWDRVTSAGQMQHGDQTVRGFHVLDVSLTGDLHHAPVDGATYVVAEPATIRDYMDTSNAKAREFAEYQAQWTKRVLARLQTYESPGTLFVVPLSLHWWLDKDVRSHASKHKLPFGSVVWYWDSGIRVLERDR